MTLEEFQVAQLYTVGVLSRENSNGDTGIEIIANEPFTNERGTGQYTHKIIQLGSKVPSYVAAVAPASMLIMHEKAWNCYPYCRTEYTVPVLGSNFSCVVESVHLPDNGSTDNAHSLSEEQLLKRKIKFLDIATDKSPESKPESDPSLIHSVKSGRGPLKKGWINNTEPIMCCYKVATITAKFGWFSGTAESYGEKLQLTVLLEFAKKAFTLTDEWYGMTMDDIRNLENILKTELEGKVESETKG